MRRTNWRVVVTGAVLAVVAIAFFLFMWSIESKSNDPVALMQTVGQVAGVVGALGIVMVIVGFVGKKT